MHDNLVRNLRELLHRNQISATQLARNIDTPQSTIQNILMGRTLDPRMSTMDRICSYFDISFEKILAPTTPGALYTHSDTASAQQVPIINWQQAINYSNFLKNSSPQSIAKWLLCDNKIDDFAFALQTKRALEPRFPVGTYLIVDPERTPMSNQLVIVYFKGTQEVAVREYLLDGSQQLLKPITADASTKVLDDAVKMIGVIYQSRYSCDDS